MRRTAKRFRRVNPKISSGHRDSRTFIHGAQSRPVAFCAVSEQRNTCIRILCTLYRSSVGGRGQAGSSAARLSSLIHVVPPTKP